MAREDLDEPTDPTYECTECGYRDERGEQSERCPNLAAGCAISMSHVNDNSTTLSEANRDDLGFRFV